MISDLRAAWDPGWVNRGQKSSNLGELRELSTMPGVLLEIAFHDSASDADALRVEDLVLALQFGFELVAVLLDREVVDFDVEQDFLARCDDHGRPIGLRTALHNGEAR